jgi:hypothetical protein
LVLKAFAFLTEFINWLIYCLLFSLLSIRMSKRRWTKNQQNQNESSRFCLQPKEKQSVVERVLKLGL